MSDDWTDEDDEKFLADLAEERRAAAALVHEVFPGVEDAEAPQPALDEAAAALRDGIGSGAPAYERLRRVTGWHLLPPGDDLPPEHRWLFAAMSSIEPHDEPTDAAAESALGAMGDEDWVTIVSGLIRDGAGSAATPEAFVRLLQDGDLLERGDEPIVVEAARLVLGDWRALGVVDDENRLTPLGVWGLPAALHDLWCGSDSGADDDPIVLLLMAARAHWETRGDEWEDDDYDGVVRLLVGIGGPLQLDLKGDRGWQPFLRAVHERTGSADAAYLLSVAADCVGDAARQQSWLDRALAADAQHEAALTDTAALASCRGDAVTACALLRRAGVPADDEELLRLRRFTHPPAQGPSRNAPCRCGSGKKYKLCCGSHGIAHPLSDRAAWLLSKAVDFARSLPYREILLARAQQLTRHVDDPLALLRALSRDPLALDAALFEDDLLAEFLEVRGPLLPQDERELADAWLDTRLAVYEVLSTRPGSSVRLRGGDHADGGGGAHGDGGGGAHGDGDDVEVRDQIASRSLDRGDLLLARLLPTGSGWMFGSVTAIPRTSRERAAALHDPEQLYELVADLQRPPRITNTEGHPLVLLEQEWSLSSAGWARLLEQLEPTNHAERWTLIRASRHIAAAFERTAQGVTVEVNSRERAEEVAGLVRAADPSAQLLAEREPTPSALAEAAAPQEVTPELEAVLREHMENYEREWCDMSIPALHGQTPREAVRTAQGRGAVEDLLADMPDLPGGMSARRLRTLLELPTPLR